MRQAVALPGTSETTVLVGVSRTGFATGADLDVALDAEGIVSAYRR